MLVDRFVNAEHPDQCGIKRSCPSSTYQMLERANGESVRCCMQCRKNGDYRITGQSPLRSLDTASIGTISTGSISSRHGGAM